MTQPTFAEFSKLAKQGNLIPVYDVFSADLLTPVSAYLRIAQGARCSFLLESVEGGEKIARYTFAGAHPGEVFRCASGACVLESRDRSVWEERGPIPFTRARDIKERRRLVEEAVAAEGPKKQSKAKRQFPLKVISNFRRAESLAAVRKAKQYIRAGDIFQVVLSQRFSVKTKAEPFEVYRELRALNPSPYLFYLQLNDVSVVGSSPEMLVKVQGRDVFYRPIAGTRWRGKDEAEDQRLEREMLASEKERAEHIMLVDLGRNDLGRVCDYGTVKAEKLLTVERYSHVMHLVSSLRGRLREDVDCFDALMACFPAGTVSGAPKVRAMEIIEELERTRRGVYAGGILYFDFSGNLDSCIALRTLVAKNGVAYVQAGGGIVADSKPQAEYQETVNKSRAVLEALRRVHEGAEEPGTSRSKRNRR